MVIFGGTGDLTYRKLMPALYNLAYGGMLPQDFAVISVGRRDMDDARYRDSVYEAISRFSRFNVDNNIWEGIKDRIYYQRFDFSDDEGYSKLDKFLKSLDEKYNAKGNRVYYLAVAPEYFGVIVDKLKAHHMEGGDDAPWRRLLIEKPFGSDLKTSRELNEKIRMAFRERDIYRIDHYLGKEMIQNIMVVRFANALFEPVWNGRFIDNIQISSTETLGVENRGGYYEKAGALRDMVQNHMLQLLTLTAMEPPVSLHTEAIRDEKVKVLRSIERFTPETALRNVVRGQYGRGKAGGKELPGYREEERVSPSSNTETYLALKVHVRNFRWGDMPFYIRTGKRLKKKSTEIVVQFKRIPQILYFKEYGGLEPNLLVIRIQPREGIFFQVNAKRPGIKNSIVPVQLDFCQNCNTGSNSPEAYERLLLDAMKGDSTLFTRWDELEQSWKFVDSISSAWRDMEPRFPNYDSGTWGPPEADELLQRDGRRWWNIEEGFDGDFGYFHDFKP